MDSNQIGIIANPGLQKKIILLPNPWMISDAISDSLTSSETKIDVLQVNKLQVNKQLVI